MPYRIRSDDYSREIYLGIQRAWLTNVDNMPDLFRDERACDLVIDSPEVAWYQVPGGAFFWVSNVGGGNGDFHVLNDKGAGLLREPKKYHPVFREIFHDLKLNRLSIFLAKPLTAHKKAALKLGFKHEGTIRKVTLFNGEYHDAEVMGMLYEDIPPKEKRIRKRPGRKRRKRPRSRNGRTSQGSGKKA